MAGSLVLRLAEPFPQLGLFLSVPLALPSRLLQLRLQLPGLRLQPPRPRLCLRVALLGVRLLLLQLPVFLPQLVAELLILLDEHVRLFGLEVAVVFEVDESFSQVLLLVPLVRKRVLKPLYSLRLLHILLLR
jgi:hypothetical protein